MTDSRRALVASAPTRLDFGGGWTDVPPYPEERGGFVCNVAINRRATVRLEATPGAAAPADPLLAAALRRGALEHVSVQCASDFPVGAGLGGSSAAGVALAAAIHAWRGESPGPAALAEWSRALEVDELGIAGGRQDHYAAAFGGALGLTFGAETDVESIALSDAATTALERQCILAYTGESRISATTITAVLDGYAARVPRIVDALESMKRLAMQMRDALHAGDINRLALLVDIHWGYQRSLHPGITTPTIEAIHAAARDAGASGMKALGASGGGCVLLFAPAHLADQVAESIAPHAEVLPWQVDRQGVTVTVQ
jgi:D-glycero-alpha-D-manno-heptose-7-phosphate kinase